MIDLNDVWRPPVQFDLPEIRRRLAATAPDWLPGLFPNARIAADRKALRCADLSGRAPRGEGSCVLHLKGPYAGTGYDHATGEFAAASTSSTTRPAFRTGRCLPRRRALRGWICHATRCRPLPRGPTTASTSPAFSGLASRSPVRRRNLSEVSWPRGSADTGSAVQCRSDRLRDGARLGRHGGCRAGRTGDPTGGIHRTFLLDDGSAKAPPGKKMLGPIAGGSVRLFPMTPERHLGIAEGIETALAAHRIFGIPVWAGLSADGVRRWQWPEGVTHVTIFADAGDAGRQAAATLADRLNDAGIANRIVHPLHGDDFNDDLRHASIRSATMVVDAAMPPLQCRKR